MGDVMDKIVIGRRIRNQREKLSLTRDVFAEQVDISPQFLAEIENGTKGMSSETLYKICDKFYLSSDYLLFGRQSFDGITTPASELLKRIPPNFSEAVENILSAFLSAVTQR
jgi:transcriptional regulator with XRE-family HTH domain